MGDRSGLTSVITNLVENAVKYSAEGSDISISLNEKGEGGFQNCAMAGHSDKEKKKKSQKFYRIGQEETRNTKGTGLGLYIVENAL
jgi:signal transduction histidine kinase